MKTLKFVVPFVMAFIHSFAYGQKVSTTLMKNQSYVDKILFDDKQSNFKIGDAIVTTEPGITIQTVAISLIGKAEFIQKTSNLKVMINGSQYGITLNNLHLPVSTAVNFYLKDFFSCQIELFADLGTLDNVPTGANINVLLSITYKVDATGKIESQSDYLQKIFWQSSTSGLENQIGDTKISLYPNPAQDFLNLSNLPENSNIRITDLIGNTLYIGTENKIDVQNLCTGFYFIEIQSDGNSQNFKFLKR